MKNGTDTKTSSNEKPVILDGWIREGDRILKDGKVYILKGLTIFTDKNKRYKLNGKGKVLDGKEKSTKD